MCEIAAIASAVTIVLGLVLGMQASSFRPVNPLGLFRGFSRRPLAMELATSEKEIDLILGPGDWNRAVMRWQQIVDFFFIASYLATFLSLAWIAAQHWVVWGLVIAALAVIAAVSDVVEDIGIVILCSGCRSVRIVATVRKAATLKWTSIFVVLIALVPLFWQCGTNAAILGSVLLAVAGLLGVAAIFTPNGRRIQSATGLMSLALLWTSGILIWAAFFGPGYCAL